MWTRYRRLTLFFLTLSLLACQPSQHSGPVKTLADFEHSDFYKTYGLTKNKSWPLANGNTDNTYEASKLSGVGVELETSGDAVVSAGLMFFKRDALGDKDLEFIYSLLQSIEPSASLTPDAKAAIKSNAEKPAHQINETTPITLGGHKIYAAKVGSEQTISVER